MSSTTLFLALLRHFGTNVQTSRTMTILGLACVSCLLVACGASTTAAKVPQQSSPPPLITPRPTVTPTPLPSPTPLPTPQPTAQPLPTPTSPSLQAAPPVLDVRPSSMSLVGHLDCTKTGAFACFARVLSRSSNQSALYWSTFTSVPGAITFRPASGTLAPGQSTLITITVPLTACTPGLFFFRGPINTHTISWAC